MLYKPVEPRHIFNPVALIYGGAAGLSIWDSNGEHTANPGTPSRELLQRFGNHVLIAGNGFKGIRQGTGTEDWLIFKWGHIAAWQQLGEAKISGSRGIFQGLPPVEAIGELLKIEAQAQAFGVQLGSWSSVARQLWKVTLEEPIRFSGRGVLRKGFYGGRKDMRQQFRGHYLTDIMHVDLKGAYPAAMMQEPIPTRFKQVAPTIEGDGVSLAKVFMPSSPWAPLPERLNRGIIRWKSGREIEGWYANVELRAAAEGGADIVPSQTHIGVREAEPFTAWASNVEMLRDQEGPAGKYWKGVSNALWGTFSMNSKGGTVLQLDANGAPARVEGFPGTRPPGPSAAYVSTLVGARVRARLLTEALDYGWNGDAIYVDTDGAMIRNGSPIPPGASDTPGLGEWKIDRVMPQVLIKALQVWAWFEENGQDHVTISGRSNATLADLHAGNWKDIVAIGS